MQTTQIEELEGKSRLLLDGIADNGGSIAVSALIKVAGDNTVSTPRRLRSALVILAYKVQSDDVTELAKRYLESLCTSPDAPLSHKIEAAELLQKHGSPKIMQPIELPGRLRFGTRPNLTGSLPIRKTIGIVAVAAFAANAGGLPPVAKITATCRPANSVASAGSRSY
jgi:hypothetical protein